jgi:hypothetical protein
MYVQWRTKPVTGQRGNWSYDGGTPGMESHSATLLRSYRDNGVVRKEIIAALGFFTTRSGVLAGRDADNFRRKAVGLIERLEISDHDMEKAVSQLSTMLEQYVTTV